MMLDAQNGVMLVDGRGIRLSPQECLFVQAMIDRMPEPVPIEEHYDQVFGIRSDPPQLRNLYKLACRLKAKFAGTSCTIEPRCSVGYRLIERA